MDGYEVWYSQNKDMSGAQYVDAKDTRAKITDLNPKKTYYVHVFSYKYNAANTKIYSADPGGKKVKTK